jgi:glycosyltransferase involved in cell wall biosynthesis
MLHRLLAGLPPGLRNLLKRIPGASAARDFLYGYPKGPAPSPGSLRPVVYLPTWLEWEVMKQRPQYLLEALAAAGHDVWFIDPRLGEERVARERIHLVPSIASTPRSGVILYTHFAPTQTLIDRFTDTVVVYDLLDDLAIYEPNEEGLPVERTVKHHHRPLVEEADIVLASNPVLADRHRTEREDLLLIENGVDIDRFIPEGPVAGSLPEGRIVGYHGAVAPWFDFELFTAVADLRPNLTFVLVGPIDPETEDRADELSKLPNVTLLPAQSSEKIADYVRGFSVGVLPFVIDEMTEAVTPLKMYEYLACGVPMVATPLPACEREEVVQTAHDPASFAARIDESLLLTAAERQDLRNHARTASWDRRVAPLLDRLESLGLRSLD